MDVPTVTASHSALDAAAGGLQQGAAEFTAAAEAVLSGAIERGVVSMKHAEVTMAAATAVAQSADQQLETLVGLLLG